MNKAKHEVHEPMPLLAQSKRNWLAPGVKVQMKTGEILTVKSLEFREFVAHERAGYIQKKDIHTIIGEAYST